LSVDPSRLDRTLHEPVRLAIAGLLASRDEASFTELREELGLTDGNLSVHLRALEEAGYVVVAKAFVERRPRTTARLSRKGREAFGRHLDALEELVRKARADVRQARGDGDVKAARGRGVRKR
jgi:DNA-binding transcriptional ArsR family regulator